MNFSLTKEQVEAREEFSKFASMKALPIASEIDRNERFPEENVQAMADYGWMGLCYPIESGGQGKDSLIFALMIEELSKVCATTGVIMSTHNLSCEALYRHGTEEQKEKYMQRLLSGEILSSFALTEELAGTDAAGVQTIAEDKGDHYLLNGSKKFVTNAGASGLYTVFAMTDKTQGTRGISALLVEEGTAGFTMEPPITKMGIRGSLARVITYKNCKIPKENLLGKEGEGFKIALQTLDVGRIGISAQALGIAQGALDVTVDYVQNREQFGRPISAFQNTEFELADMQTKITAARHLVYDAARRKDTGRRFSMEASMAKLFASQTAMDTTTRCVQLFGGNGYTGDYPVERMMRDAKITEIYEGTSEVQKMVISSHMLK